MDGLPSGTVTFLFSDVEGSTRLLERHGAAMGAALARHHALFEETVERHGGAIFETVGDAVYAAFATAPAGAAAALDAHRALATEEWGPVGRIAVRIALHSGTVELRGKHYFGPVLFRAARLQALGYGEQTLLSAATARLAADALPLGASLRDLGTHRLRDLGEPEHVYQLVHADLRADFPPPKSLDARPHNLPIQLSSFIGREAELAEIGQILRAHRLVTLLGPGGIGKTRLALQVGAEVLDAYPDGVFFVDLAPVRDPELLPGIIAATVGLRQEPGQPIGTTLREHLAGKSMLLVLDNLEQLLPPAAQTVADLLSGAGDLRILATSRAPLGIRGERVYAVSSLASGDPRRPNDEPPAAVALFVERARDIRPDVVVDEQTGPLIAGICTRLDGMPLAIELAAARLRLFGLQDLSERLEQRLPLLTGGARDLAERHRTLRAAIAWSEELLSEAERRLFARLGVFVGGWTLEAAEVVCAERLEGDVLEGLGRLVDHSLVRAAEGIAGQSRFSMLETVREYAAERLEAGGEAKTMHDAHAEYFVSLAERARAEIDGPNQQLWYRRLDQDVENLRAALKTADRGGSGELVLRYGAALYPHWASRGLLQDWRSWADRARGRLEGAAPPLIEANPLHAIAFLLVVDGDLTTAETMYRQAAMARRDAGDLRGAANSLNNLGTIHLDRGDFTVAEKVFRECLELQPGAAAPTVNLGECALELGQHAEALQLFTEALRIFREAGDEESEVYALGSLGRLALAQSDFDRSRQLIAEARQLAEQHGDIAAGPRIDLFEASLLMRTGRVSASCVLALAGLDYLHELGFKREIATALDIAAEAALRCDEPAAAGRLWGAEESLLSALGSSLGTRTARERSDLIEHLTAGVMRSVLEEGLVDGRSLDVDSAVRLAHATLERAAKA